MIELMEFYENPKEMTVKKASKRSPILKTKLKAPKTSLGLVRICSTKQFINFATTVKYPSTKELNECNELIENEDDITFVYPTKMPEVSKMLGKLKKNRAFENDGVSAEVLKTSLLVVVFISCEILVLFLSRTWI